jgi:hypothetical protein
MFTVYDSARYMGNPGFYCPGQDVVSDRLQVEGMWEPHDTPVIERILRAGDRSRRVIDFGAHLGWYSVMAAKLGYGVVAIDGDSENLRLLRTNLATHGLRACVIWGWVNEHFTYDPDPRSEFELVKIDIESHERHAVNAIWPCIDRVHNLYVEISPAFRDDYPALVDRLVGAGFQAFWPDDRPFDGDYSLGQFNLRFSR